MKELEVDSIRGRKIGIISTANEQRGLSLLQGTLAKKSPLINSRFGITANFFVIQHCLRRSCKLSFTESLLHYSQGSSFYFNFVRLFNQHHGMVY